ncbi:MAG: HU family DNA-binding protein [Bacteroides sp.]
MSEKLTVQDLARGAAEKMGMTKGNAEAFIKEFFQLIADALHQDKYVKVKGLGTFKLIEVDSRASVDVNTGERIEIQGHTKVSFTPDAALRDLINRPFAHFETVPLQNEELLLSTAVEDESTVAEESVVAEETVAAEEPVAAEESVASEEPVAAEKSVAAEDIVDAVEAPLKEAPAPLDEEYPPLEEEFQDRELDEPQLAAEEQQPAEQQVESTASESLTEEELAEQKNTMRYFIGIVVFISLLCIGVLVFIYFPGLTRALYGLKEPVEQTVDSVIQPVESVQVEAADSLRSDTLKPIQEVPEPVSAVEQLSVPQQSSGAQQPSASKGVVPTPFVPDSSSYEIVGTQESYTLQEGETLTKVALRYWGTKKLWPYLVKHNPTVIKNPDNVPYGTTIKIPKLKKK